MRAVHTCVGMDTDETSLLLFAATSDSCDEAFLLAAGSHTVGEFVISYVAGEDC